MSSPELTLPPLWAATGPGGARQATPAPAPAPAPALAPAPAPANELVLEGRAMATRITVRVPFPNDASAERQAGLEAAARDALAVFAEVEAACTRFDPASPLMRANRSPNRWHRVPPILLKAVGEAKRAYDATGGRMDPRVLRQLVALGYDRTLPFGASDVQVETPRRAAAGHPAGAWRPRLRHGASEVRIGDDPIDLGGIGKGLAVRWAGERLSRATADFLVDAGGDCACAGRAPGGGPWLVGVEDPSPPTGTAGGGEGPLATASPVAVLALSDRAVTTSSIRLRRWKAGGRAVHHLIDPRTGRPGGEGLLSVTVVGADPATAEAWSKALFLAGEKGIAELARRRRLAALWVDEGGETTRTAAMGRYVQWQRP